MDEPLIMQPLASGDGDKIPGTQDDSRPVSLGDNDNGSNKFNTAVSAWRSEVTVDMLPINLLKLICLLQRSAWEP